MENENAKLKKALTSFSNSVSDKFTIAKQTEVKLGAIDKIISKQITNWLFKKEIIAENEKEGINSEVSGIIKIIKGEIDESESAKSIFESFLPVVFEFFERSSKDKEEE
ncbi:hypothetical protein QKV40_gp20 [Varidnaviria sp.]|uniref:Uncharacterized protein n=1 Tax=Lokiarchaeia virus SkuldV1 TaxID=3058189 RepID=A0AA46MAY9_9VIRU|nr:hypothetical protein QKV40_gp20 [Varidnaviria sp.]UPO70974.1 hypothetical protein 11324_00020 [Lokiarchaeia virus SkuldV1]